MSDGTSDEPSEESLNHEFKEQAGFGEDDETPEAQPSSTEKPAEPADVAMPAQAPTPETSPAPVQPAAPAERVVTTEDKKKFADQAKRLTGVSAKQVFEAYAEAGLPIGKTLATVCGYQSLPQGKSLLWFKGKTETTGDWMFIMSPKVEGPLKPGFRVVLGIGEEIASTLYIRTCAILTADDNNANNVSFNKSCLVTAEDGKFVAGAPLSEGQLSGMVRAGNFGKSPFSLGIE